MIVLIESLKIHSRKLKTYLKQKKLKIKIHMERKRKMLGAKFLDRIKIMTAVSSQNKHFRKYWLNQLIELSLLGACLWVHQTVTTAITLSAIVREANLASLMQRYFRDQLINWHDTLQTNIMVTDVSPRSLGILTTGHHHIHMWNV